jgi:2-oxoglutarate ferredoxin oxidoreductase subunit beta
MWPSIFCTGCGVGNVLHYTLRALDKIGLSIDKTVFCSGIGCSSRLPGYVDADGLHTTHGRAIAFATGVKLANPDLTTIVFTGDGDLAGIGGNHFIHAARRNLDLTVICVNNYNYGMTGGQVSPTTPVEALSTTTPYGNLEEPFDLCRLAIGSGAPFVARWTPGFPHETVLAVEKALRHRGFSFVEILAPCPTGFGKGNRFKDSRQIWTWYREQTITRSELQALEPEARAANKKIVVGTLWHEERPELWEQWQNMVRSLNAETPKRD